MNISFKTTTMIQQIKNKNKISMKTITCFPGEDAEDHNNKDKYRKKINRYTNILLQNTNIDYHNHPLDLNDDNPLYILLWNECNECNDLRRQMILLNLKHIFINIEIELLEIQSPNINLFPLLYKEDICVGNNLFDIYEEIYSL